MRKLVPLLCVIGLSLAAKSALAQDRPYGTAGCGLGSIVFGAKPGIIQIFAATTNGTFGTQTFGITTGTSNCVDDPGAGGATASFIETNREVLAKDIARGNGETIATLSTLAGCKSPANVGKTLQGRYQEIFPSSDVTNIEVSATVVTILRTDESLSCTKLQAKKQDKPAKPAKSQIASKGGAK